MQYGVDYKLFWHLNPRKLTPFRKAYEKDTDFKAWLHGNYVAEAIACCFGKDHEYPSMPRGLKKEQTEQISTLTDAEKFAMFAKQFNNAHKTSFSEEKE